MQDFFSEVHNIRGDINHIKERVDDMKKKHSDILSSPQPKPEDQAEVDRIMKEVKKVSNNVRMKLKEIEKSIEEDKLQHNLKSPADLRIRKNQHSSLHYSFLQVMTEYSNSQVEYREKCKGRIHRQLEITGQNTTDEEIEEMLETGNAAIFTSSIIADTQQAKQALGDIEARYDELMKLEQSIKELHEMFLDMAMMVEQQGEMIDSIEHNVEEAAEYVAQAEVATKSAVKYQSKARRKKIIIIAIIAIAITVIVLLIVFL
ncbi:syntaxin-1A-like [Saccoglossus kowalevskii]|uniref:Syntaxin-like n=1 Tax=Saccoglossus kowalevskii TaxID=10224 RepID=A0ABM0GNW8_SACKO|nr:PREDICTED: syntaxin-like [Saccoglossus kowalevskii]